MPNFSCTRACTMRAKSSISAARGASQVHQYQCLPFMDAYPSASAAFQPRLVDEPPGGEFGLARKGGGVERHVGPAGPPVAAPRIHRPTGFLKKLPALPVTFGSGSLGAADGADCLADVAQRRAAAGFDFALHVAVPQPGLRRTRKADVHRRDDDTSPQVVLEDAFAVTETAVRGVERHAFAVFHAEHVYPLDRVLRLAAVGADVLHGRRPGLAGDQRGGFRAPHNPRCTAHSTRSSHSAPASARTCTVPPSSLSRAIRCETGVSSSPS